MMKKSRNIFLMGVLGLVWGCESKTPDYTTANNNTTEVQETEQLAKGFQLLETNCFSCHSPNATLESRIAPPMVAIKKHYITEGTTKTQFTKDLIAFLANPSKEASKMPNAVQRFGLMPKMNFSEDQIRSIADYIFETELEKPEWFEKHYESERKKYLNQNKVLSYEEQGLNFAMQTKSVLGKNLLQAINTKGTEGALEFCSTKAYPLTDSMATALQAKIKRVSDKNRNPNNAANEKELTYIHKAQELLASGQKIKPQLTEEDGMVVGYYPILADKMCMQCHGKPDVDILASTLAKTKQIYPNDKAVGYAPNDLRGIWVVEMYKLAKK